MIVSTRIVIALLIAAFVRGDKAVPGDDVKLTSVKEDAKNDAVKNDDFKEAPMKISPAEQKMIDEVRIKMQLAGVNDTPTGIITKGLGEFIAMTLLVFIGCGTAMSVPDQGHKLFHVSLVFGFAYTALSYAVGHYGGGHLNCAVTFGLWCAGNISATHGFTILMFQLAGSVLGAFLTTFVFTEETDETRPNYLFTNFIQGRFQWWQAFFGEFVCTFLLVYVFIESAVNPATSSNRPEACLAIGFTVFVIHCVLIPVDGCSTNPARSFGPMLVRKMFRQGGKQAYLSQQWIFWSAPLLGASFAAGVYTCMHQDEQMLTQVHS